MDDTLKLIKLAQSGNKEAMEKLVSDNVRLIWSIVKRFKNRGYEADDLFQIGSMGLIRCIKKFDVGFNVKFSTYAVPMIMGEIRRFMRDDGMIKISRPLKETAVKAKYVCETLAKKNGREPTVNEVAEELGIEREDVIMAMEADKEVESLYSIIYQGDNNPVYLIDKLTEKKDETENILIGIMIEETIGKLRQKEQKVIKMRYYEDKTQSEVAKEIGVSQVQVSRIEKKVINYFREHLKTE